MSHRPEPPRLTPLLSDPWPSADASAATLRAPAAPVLAAEVVESLRLWERPAGGRPHLLVNMISTLDGRATLSGRSGPIGNRGDRELFNALRTTVDAVLVGAGTARAEHYSRLVRDAPARQLRRERGLAEEPLVCVVSASLALPPEDVPLLADPAARVAILTASPASLPACAAPVEYVRSARDGMLDLPAALAELQRRLGVRTVLCEGGPHLNAQLLASGLVDELFLSLAPKLASGDTGTGTGESLRILSGPALDPPVELELLSVLESESLLLLRYRVDRAADVGRS